MRSILKYLSDQGSFLYQKFGYRITDSEAGSMDSGRVVLEKEDIEIQLIAERGIVFMNFRRKGDFRNEFSVARLRRFITHEIASDVINHDDEWTQFVGEKIQELNPTDYQKINDGHRDFLMEHIPRIESLLSQLEPEEIQKTSVQLRELEEREQRH